MQRFGGQLTLLVVVALFWGSWQMGRASTGEGERVAGDTAVSIPTSSTNTTPTPAPDYTPGTLPVLSDIGLAPAPKPLTYQGKLPQHELQTYVVERGDTPGGIAQRFNILPETFLGGNPRLSEESNLLQTGVELIILPIDGVLHDVQPGDTLESLSAEYGIPMADIIAYAPNNLEFPYRLYPETQVMVPGAVREVFRLEPT